VIAEIETDKATMEVEALDDGVMAKLVVAEGTQNVAVNALIAVLAEEGEDASEAAKEAENAPITAPTAASTPAPTPAPTAASTPAPTAASTPAPTPASAPAAPQLAAGQKGERVFASPLARRIAGDAGLDIGNLAGTGPHGRIIRADVEEAIAKAGTIAAAPSAAASMMRVAGQSERDCRTFAAIQAKCPAFLSDRRLRDRYFIASTKSLK
jgi:pyruvate dehydrogenase E2 component (dihydrolipoamide acetyltransferase)